MIFSAFEISKLKRVAALAVTLFLFFVVINSYSYGKDGLKQIGTSGATTDIYEYKGFIQAGSKKLTITMNLEVHWSQVTGTYQYDNYKEPITIKGLVDVGGNFILSEYDKKGKEVGTFHGTNLEKDVAEGIWSSAKGKSFSFHLYLVKRNRGWYVYPDGRLPDNPIKLQTEIKVEKPDVEYYLKFHVAGAVKQLPKSKSSCGGYDYFPHGGIKTIYCHIDSVLSYKMINEVARRNGMTVFVKGPHTEDTLNLGASTFGHYNKDFVIWLRENAIPGDDNKLLKKTLQPIYNRYLKSLARIFYREYLEFGQKREWYGNRASMAEGFWQRRSVDGTKEEFYKGLKKLLSIYDKEVLNIDVEIDDEIAKVERFVYSWGGRRGGTYLEYYRYGDFIKGEFLSTLDDGKKNLMYFKGNIKDSRKGFKTYGKNCFADGNSVDLIIRDPGSKKTNVGYYGKKGKYNGVTFSLQSKEEVDVYSIPITVHKEFDSFQYPIDAYGYDSRVEDPSGTVKSTVIIDCTDKVDLMEFSPLDKNKVKVMRLKSAPHMFVVNFRGADLGIRRVMPPHYIAVVQEGSGGEILVGGLETYYSHGRSSSGGVMLVSGFDGKKEELVVEEVEYRDVENDKNFWSSMRRIIKYYKISDGKAVLNRSETINYDTSVTTIGPNGEESVEFFESQFDGWGEVSDKYIRDN